MHSSRALKKILTGISAVALAFAGTVLIATPAAAVTYPVTNESELVQAITDANNSTGMPDIITLSGTITLTTALPAITDDLAVIGDAGSSIVGTSHPLFHDTGATPNITLEFENVHITSATFAIETNHSNVKITASTFDNAPVSIGGTTIAVDVSDSQFDNAVGEPGMTVAATDGAQIAVARVTASGNSIAGIGILDPGPGGATTSASIVDSAITSNDEAGLLALGENLELLVERTVISENGGTSGFGGIGFFLSGDSSLTLHSSTVSDNVGEGGGIVGLILDGTPSFTMVNSTVSGNDTGPNVSPAFPGGGVTMLAGQGGATATVSHSTIVNNNGNVDDISGLSFSGVQYTVDHSILAGNTANGSPVDFALDGSTGTVSHSLVQVSAADALTAVTAGIGNLQGIGAQLGPLADNGGPTFTHLPLVGSPVIDAGDPAITGAPATDQRGQARIVGIIDMGAVELAGETGTAGGGPVLAATGVDATPYIIGGGVLLGLGAVLMLLVTRRKRHTAR